MTKSYRRIDYRLRPAKNVERKMIVESLRRLDGFGQISAYQYIGFGSMPFADFILFHRSLDVSRMVSIERQVSDQDRLEFNRPLSCIDLRLGEASSVLPTLDWTVRTIVWLDYEDELDRTILSDIEHVVSNAPSGSALIVSVNAHPGEETGRADRVKRALGVDLLPSSITDVKLGGWKKATLYHQLINEAIHTVVRNRSGGVSPPERVRYQQIFHFCYQDGPRMLTTGGVIVSEAEESVFENCRFSNDSFFRDGDEPFAIEIPIITPREILYIGRCLPLVPDEELDLGFLPPSEIAKLSRIFRYFPTFVEADI